MSSVIYNGFIIHLTGPICNCQEENLGWHLTGTMASPGIRFFCQTCSMEVRVPAEQVGASWALDEPYPGAPVVVTPPVSRINLSPPEGKLLHFRVDTAQTKEGA